MKVFASVLFFVLFFINCYSQDSINHHTEIKTAPWYVERFRLSAGFFVPITNTNLQVGVKGGMPGTPINLEKDLGFDDGDRARHMALDTGSACAARRMVGVLGHRLFFVSGKICVTACAQLVAIGGQLRILVNVGVVRFLMTAQACRSAF